MSLDSARTTAHPDNASEAAWRDVINLQRQSWALQTNTAV
jgi:hypothetical protein